MSCKSERCGCGCRNHSHDRFGGLLQHCRWKHLRAGVLGGGVKRRYSVLLPKPQVDVCTHMGMKKPKKEKKRKQNTECVGDLWVWGYLVRRKEWQKKVTTEFVVTDGEKDVSLLLGESSEKLGFLRVGPPSDVVGSLSQKLERNEKYRSLYSGLGKLKERRSLCRRNTMSNHPFRKQAGFSSVLDLRLKRKSRCLRHLLSLNVQKGVLHLLTQ